MKKLRDIIAALTLIVALIAVFPNAVEARSDYYCGDISGSQQLYVDVDSIQKYSNSYWADAYHAPAITKYHFGVQVQNGTMWYSYGIGGWTDTGYAPGTHNDNARVNACSIILEHI